MIYGCLWLTLAVAEDLVHPNLLIPACDGKEVFRVRWIWVEYKVGDCVFGGITERDVLLQVAKRVACRGSLRSKQARHRGWCEVYSSGRLVIIGATVLYAFAAGARRGCEKISTGGCVRRPRNLEVNPAVNFWR